MPLVYTRHTSRFLIIWLTTLPFGLWMQFHWCVSVLWLIVWGVGPAWDLDAVPCIPMPQFQW